MKFTGSPTERTTAITDIIVSLVALAAMGCMKLDPDADPAKIAIWIAAFGLIALASILGACAHGMASTDIIEARIWRVLNLCLGLAVSLFVVGVVYDLGGAGAARRTLPYMITAGVVFFLVTLRFTGIFFLFIIYEATVLVFALCSYSWLAITVKSPGALWMAAGVLTSLVAAIVQAVHSSRVKIIWSFDHNGIFHILQAIGLLLLMTGIIHS